MDELRRNGSGYYDPTAYKALKGIEREENKMEVRKGEIWEIEIGNQVRTAVVLATHGSYSIVLTFTDEPRERRTVQINAQGMKYTEPGMISYKFHDNFVKFIRLTKDEEFGNIMVQVAGALGIENEVPFGIVESEEVHRLQVELIEAEDKLAISEERRDKLQRILNTMDKPEEETIKLKTERDLYKSQYESLLERVLAKAV